MGEAHNPGMTEYGNVVGQGASMAGGGHAAGAANGDVGAAVGASFNGVIQGASTALGVPPTVLVAAVVVLLFLVLYLRFAR